MSRPRWLGLRGVDMAAPEIAAEIQVRAAWVALHDDGAPVRHGLGCGFLTRTPRLFTGPEAAAEWGRPALVDLYGGEPVRLHRSRRPSLTGAT